MLATAVSCTQTGIPFIYFTITFLVVVPSLIMYVPGADILLTRVPESNKHIANVIKPHQKICLSGIIYYNPTGK